MKRIGLIVFIMTLFLLLGFTLVKKDHFSQLLFRVGTFYKYIASLDEGFHWSGLASTETYTKIEWDRISGPLEKLNHKKQSEPNSRNETEKVLVHQSDFEREVIRLTNIERERQGLAPLKTDARLTETAQEKSLDMASNHYFSHDSPTYGSPFEMMDSFGITYYSAGENIARGQITPKEVVEAWMDSEGHRENILHPDFTHIGVGYVENGHYWTQQFIKRLDDSVNQLEYEKRVVELTNKEREKRGLSPLLIDQQLMEVARTKSKDMAKENYFDHTSPNYGSPFDMMEHFGVHYVTAGENIARGQFTPEEVVEAWMESEGHRANILNPEYTHIGVGFIKEDIIWTQQFIGK
jgi:uncharacterized YkwD family protein